MDGMLERKGVLGGACSLWVLCVGIDFGTVALASIHPHK